MRALRFDPPRLKQRRVFAVATSGAEMRAGGPQNKSLRVCKGQSKHEASSKVVQEAWSHGVERGEIVELERCCCGVIPLEGDFLTVT